MKNIEAVGKIVWLMGQSKVHQGHDIADIHRVILPPVALQQYRLWESDGFPVGFMSYALCLMKKQKLAIWTAQGLSSLMIGQRVIGCGWLIS
jgi:hemolysin-activating ACP:hemolysin acyltransferase